MIASATLLGLVAALSVSAPRPLHFEAEDGRLTGIRVAAERAGFTGSGYVTGFDAPEDGVTFTFTAPAGLYEVRLRYGLPNGEKGYDLTVNGARRSGMFPATTAPYAATSAGKVELQAGENTLTVGNGWGWFDLDAVDLIPVAAPAPLRRVKPRPADPLASREARALLARLTGLYGHKTLSGQYEPAESAFIRDATGHTPAILGGDLMDYSPSRVEHGAAPQGTTERLLAAAKTGRILTLSWHWNAPAGLRDTTYTDAQGRRIEAPWYRGFYTDATTFDLEQALARPDSREYRLLLRDMDAIAGELKKLDAAKVPVLWRPLHEADGAWFWWGAKGPEPFRRLWRLLYERLTAHHRLHNLIWVWSGEKLDWYPGDAFVDIAGVDAYPKDPRDPLSALWDTFLHRFDGKKLIALTEIGGVPDVDRMRRYGVRWSYFVSWTGDLGPRKVPPERLRAVYGSPWVMNAPVTRSAAPKPVASSPVTRSVAPKPVASSPVKRPSLKKPGR